MTSSSKPRPLPPPGETRAYPVLPLRDIVVFPHMIVPLFVGREKSIRALEEVMRSDTFILLATQKNASDDDPATDAIFEVGTLASVLQLLKLPDGTVKVLVEGTRRAHIDGVDAQDDLYFARLTALDSNQNEDNEVEAMRRALVAQFDQYIKLNKKIPPEILSSISGIEDTGRLCDTIAAHLPLKLEQKQEVLELLSVRERTERLLSQLESEIDILQVEKRIRGRVKRQMEKSQREYYLNEQVKAIQKELGEQDENADI